MAVLTRCSINPHMTALEYRHVGKQCVVISVGTELRWDKASGLNDVISPSPFPQSLITVTNSFSHNSKNLYEADTNFVFAYLFLFPLHQIPFFPYFYLPAYFCFFSIRAKVIIILMCAHCRVSRQETWRSEVSLSINFRNEGSCIKCGTERTD